MKEAIIIILLIVISSIAEKMFALWEKSEHRNVNSVIFGITTLGVGLLILLGKMLVNYD